jgi:hypothetical protein
MKVALGKVISPGMKFEHIYDFGTSTELSLKFVSAREGFAQNKAVGILARNDPPDIRCQCGKTGHGRLLHLHLRGYWLGLG